LRIFNKPKVVIMHMMDWNTYRQQVVAGVGGIAQLSPDTVKGYATLSGAGEKTGHLDAKTRELIALAVRSACVAEVNIWSKGRWRFF
jgi:hypothetical protein